MAAQIGTLEADNIFGTDGGDILVGFGYIYPDIASFRAPQDFVQGNDGDDTLSGAGNITGGPGNDRYSNVNGAQTELGFGFDGGEGNDWSIVHRHAWNVETAFTVPGGADTGNGVTSSLGAGNDRLILGQSSDAFSNSLGAGKDKVWIMGRNAELAVSDNLSTYDGDRDTVMISGPALQDSTVGGGGAVIVGFGPEDRIKLHQSGLTYETLALRSTLEGTSVRITLPNDAQVFVRKEFEGLLGEEHIKLVDKPLTVTVSGVLHGNSATPEKTWFGSPDGETVAVKGRALLMGMGDDTGKGDGKANRIDGEDGADLVLGRGGDDILSGGRGDDTLKGGPGDDLLLPGSGIDRSDGQGGNDRFVLGRGDDIVKGGDGNDRFEFKQAKGEKIITGGKGKDVYVFGDGLDFAADRVVIRDFTPGKDKLDFSAVDNPNLSYERLLGFEGGEDALGLGRIVFEDRIPGGLTADDFIL